MNLQELKGKRISEGWDPEKHEPVKTKPIKSNPRKYRPKMDRRTKKQKQRAKAMAKFDARLAKHVEAKIRAEGPVQSAASYVKRGRD